MKTTLRASLLALSLVSLVACGTVDAPAPEMSMDEMMARMAALGAPGEGHAVLAPMVGAFDVKGTFWLDPAAPPMVSHATSVNTMAMGGRFLQQDFRSDDFMGAPYRGLGFTGYNNVTGLYESLWLDDQSTWMMPLATGGLNAAGDEITFARDVTDPLTGVESRTREVLRFPDADHHSFAWYQTGPDGIEMQVMLLEYTRAQ